MKVSQEVREFARLNPTRPRKRRGRLTGDERGEGAGNQPGSGDAEGGIFNPEAAEAADKGMRELSEKFRETGGGIYVLGE